MVSPASPEQETTRPTTTTMHHSRVWFRGSLVFSSFSLPWSSDSVFLGGPRASHGYLLPPPPPPPPVVVVFANAFRKHPTGRKSEKPRVAAAGVPLLPCQVSWLSARLRDDPHGHPPVFSSHHFCIGSAAWTMASTNIHQKNEKKHNSGWTSARREGQRAGEVEEERKRRGMWPSLSSMGTLPSTVGRPPPTPAGTRIPIVVTSMGKDETSAAVCVGATAGRTTTTTKGKEKGDPTPFATRTKKKKKRKDHVVGCCLGRGTKEETNPSLPPHRPPPPLPLGEKTKATHCCCPPLWGASLAPLPSPPPHPVSRKDFPAGGRLRMWGCGLGVASHGMRGASSFSFPPCTHTSETEPWRQTATQFGPKLHRRRGSTHP